MQPVRIANSLPKPLGAPEDWDPEKHGHCGGLFVRIDNDRGNGLTFIRSAWEPDDREACLLLAGGKVILGVSGTCQPVVSLQVAQVPEDFDPVVTARRIVTPTGYRRVRVEMLYPNRKEARRAFAEIPIEDGVSFAASTAEGIAECEALARQDGWEG